ncbi:RNA polymerase sigma factor [Nocardia alni]|uniref:RNA polymerase sigma factor n=1 Tax=Nocardia alni TaxID=2815723 RepID=UPI001C249F0D|nr:sigma-70 family RNA polymerase sigma factor [Nocardia alni]
MTNGDRLLTAHIEALYRQYAPAVYRLAFLGLRGDANEANDVVQQVFVAVCEQYDTHFRNHSADRQGRLITTMTKRRVIDCYRRAHRSREILCGELAELDRPTSVLSEFPHAVERSDRITEDPQLKQLWDVLTRDLTGTEYRVAFMTWELDMTPADIAKTLNTTSNAVCTHRSHAKRKIREAHDIGHKGGADA